MPQPRTFVDRTTQSYIALVGLLILVFHNQTVPYWHWLLAAHVVNLALVHLLLKAYDRRPTSKALDLLRHFYPVLLYTWFFSETGWLNRIFFIDFMDPAVIRFEQSLFGCQPSVLFMEKLPFLVLSELFYASYFSYYLMIAGVGIALFLRNRTQFFHYVTVLSLVFYVCYLLYIILPIIGPRLFFGPVAGYRLPDNVMALAPVHTYPAAVTHGPFFKLMGMVYDVFEAPGSALPSSHVAVALTTVFFSFLYLRPIRWVHLLVAVLLCLATVYCRYHYVIDVLSGLITAAVLVPLGNWLYKKYGGSEIQVAGASEARAFSGVKLEQRR
jgi:membrane-associated phospholipid phosphatase